MKIKFVIKIIVKKNNNLNKTPQIYDIKRIFFFFLKIFKNSSITKIKNLNF